MAETVLYRKWRPADFEQVVGQGTVVQTLRNAVAQDRIAHAYLFCGPRGTGKTTTARILAHAINGHTSSDRANPLGPSGDMSFDLIEIDAASNRGIDDIRDLREKANFQPGSARFKVYLIDEVHQLTGAAMDALLKTLEEPPPHVVFILATTDPEALKPTILSRCQRFDFRRVSVDDMVGRLRAIADAERIEIPDDALRLISREATGSLRDGVNLLDQVWVMCGSTVSLDAAQEALGLSPDARAMDLASAALRADLAGGLSVLAAVQEDALDFGRFNKQVVQHLRHTLLVLTGATDALSLSAPEIERLQEVASGVDAAAAVTALRAFSAANVRRDPYQPLPLELALASIVYGPRPTEIVPAAAPAPSSQRSSGQDRSRRQQPQRREQQATRSLPKAPSQPRPAQLPAPGASQTEAAAPADELLDAIRVGLRRRGQGMIATMLNGSCRITEQSNDSLTLGFLPNYQQVHMQKVIEAQSHVDAATTEALQRPVTVRCVPLSASASSTSTGAPSPSPTTQTPYSPPSPRSDVEPPARSVAEQPRRESVIEREARARFGARPYQTN